MELEDCAFPLLAGIDITDDATAAFDGVNVALLVGARPRTKGMERGDLLEANGGIFAPQGRAINAGAADDVRVLVVGNPANTNALIAQVRRAGRAGRPVHRDDPPGPQPGRRAAGRRSSTVPVAEISRLTIWGNHSATQYPDIFHAEVDGKTAAEQVDEAWLRDEFIPPWPSAAPRSSRCAGRRRRPRPPTRPSTTSSTGSTAPPEGDWTSAAIPSDGSYGVRRGHDLAASRSPPRAAAGRSSRAWRSTSSPGSGSTPAWPSWRRSATRSRRSACSSRYLQERHFHATTLHQVAFLHRRGAQPSSRSRTTPDPG